MRFGVIPVDTHDVRFSLRAWEILFVCMLLLCVKYAKLSVDCYVCGSRQNTNIDMVNNVHGRATIVRRRKGGNQVM